MPFVSSEVQRRSMRALPSVSTSLDTNGDGRSLPYGLRSPPTGGAQTIGQDCSGRRPSAANTNYALSTNP